MSQAAFAALFLTNATAARAESADTKSPQRGLIPSIYQKKDLLLKALVLFLFSQRIDN